MQTELNGAKLFTSLQVVFPWQRRGELYSCKKIQTYIVSYVYAELQKGTEGRGIGTDWIEETRLTES